MPRQRVEEAAVHGVRGAGDQVRLVDQHQVALLHVVGAAVDRLDAGEEDAGAEVAPAEPGGVDAGRRVAPEADQLGVVLRDQLADVGDDQDALVGPGAQHALDEGGHDEALAAGGRDHDQRVAAVLGEVAVDRVDGGLLVGAERQHATASARASLTQVRAVAHAVDDMIVAGVDDLAGHEIGDEEVPGAGLPLRVELERLVPAGAVPAALDRRRMQAGAAGDRGGRLAMAELVVVAEPALEPGGVLGDARRRPGGVDDAAGLGEQPLGGVAVGADALDVQIVGVLADREVHRARQAGQVHVDLHLRPVLRLGLGDALGDQLAEALQPSGS